MKFCLKQPTEKEKLKNIFLICWTESAQKFIYEEEEKIKWKEIERKKKTPKKNTI